MRNNYKLKQVIKMVDDKCKSEIQFSFDTFDGRYILVYLTQLFLL